MTNYKTRRGNCYISHNNTLLAARFRSTGNSLKTYLGFRCTRKLNTGSSRVFRGGCWLIDAANCRAASRHGNGPGGRDGNLGLRTIRIGIVVGNRSAMSSFVRHSPTSAKAR